MTKDIVATSKFLSLVLRHRPDVIGITLDAEGWVPVEDLLAACAQHGRAISREQLDVVVRTNDKQRFAFSADGSRIRANQGHSVPIDLGLVSVEPPELLYHGTVPRFPHRPRAGGIRFENYAEPPKNSPLPASPPDRRFGRRSGGEAGRGAHGRRRRVVAKPGFHRHGAGGGHEKAQLQRRKSVSAAAGPSSWLSKQVACSVTGTRSTSPRTASG